MSAVWLSALLVVLVGALLRPRPEARRPPSTGDTAGGPQRTGRTPRSTALRSLRAPWRRRRDHADAEDIGAWCENLAGAVRTGSTLGHAIRSTTPPAPITATIDAIVLALDRGVPLAEAAVVDRPGADLALALTVIRACAETGGSAAEPLDRAAVALRGRAAERADRRTHSAQSRLSASVMTWLPIAMLAVLVVGSRSVRGVAVTAPGATLIAFGGALNLLGWRWMRRLITDGVA